MSYRLLLHKNVTKFLNKCPAKQRAGLIEKLEKLKQDPVNTELDIKVLQGCRDVYRLRIGQVRLIYQVRNNELVIFIMKAGWRGDIYK